MKGSYGRRILAAQLPLVAALLLCISCASWQQIAVPIESSSKGKQYARLRVEPANGGFLVLRDPWVAGDTLYGLSENRVHVKAGSASGLGVAYEEGDSVKVPIDQIAKLEARRFSSSKTILMIYGVGTTVGMIITCIGGDCSGGW